MFPKTFSIAKREELLGHFTLSYKTLFIGKRGLLGTGLEDDKTGVIFSYAS